MNQKALTPEYKLRLKNYYKKCIISEGSKLIIFSLIFYSLSLFKEYLIALFLLLVLRTNGGGLHCKKYRSCFLLSFFMILGNIVFAHYFAPTLIVFCIILLICLPIMMVLVPITSAYRPKPSTRIVKKSKIITFIFTLFFMLYSCTIAPKIVRNIGFWTIIMHTGQLIFAKITKTRR